MAAISPDDLEARVLACSVDVGRLLRSVYGDELVSVALFGSAARRRLHRGSDLDHLVVLTAPQPTYGKRTRRLLPVLHRIRETAAYAALEEAGLDLEPSFLVLTTEEVARHPPVLLDMVTDRRILHDADCFLAHELARVGERMREFGSVRKHLPDGSWYWVLKPDLRSGEIVEL